MPTYKDAVNNSGRTAAPKYFMLADGSWIKLNDREDVLQHLPRFARYRFAYPSDRQTAWTALVTLAANWRISLPDKTIPDQIT